MKKLLLCASAITLLAACANSVISPQSETQSAPQSVTRTASAVTSSLDAILATQPAENQARYQYRNPKETIEFIGIEPGMKVIDILPGGGYYSRILLPYLGSEGGVVGVDYSPEMWKLFGGFANEEFLEAKKTWPATWTAQANEWRKEGDADVSAFAFGDVPEELTGTIDAVMMVRAFHHLNRFEEEGGFRVAALQDLYKVLKPGGIVGVVQHRSPEGNDDVWAEGDNGYVKQSHVIATMEAAGFTFEGSSEINANPKDQPSSDEENNFVWRLPPALGTSRDNPELRAKMVAIGESDRMTLKFTK